MGSDQVFIRFFGKFLNHRIVMGSFVLLMLAAIASPVPAATRFTINEAKWERDDAELEIKGRAPAGAVIQFRDSALDRSIGTATANRKGKWRLKLRRLETVPCRIAATYDGRQIETAVEDAPRDCSAAPAPPEPVPPSDPPGKAEIVALEITGPSAVAENAGAQYQVAARFSDGTAEDVSLSVAWEENSPYAAIDGLGYLTTDTVSGEESLTVSARYGSLTGSMPVVIQNATEELMSLYMSGPDSLTEGQTASYAVTAVYTSGTTEEIQSGLEWDVTPPGAATIDTAGNLTAQAVDADQGITVSAAYTAPGGLLTATAAVTVLNTAENVSGSHAGRFSAFEGTATCLECHTAEAMDVHASVHYQWKGDASEAVGLSTDVAGKMGGINDFCIYPDINWIGKLNNINGEAVDGGCAKCHAGLGAKPSPEATQAQLENIDCLVCHSDTYKRTVAMVDGQYRFVPDADKMGVSILQAASDITLPSNDSCLNCHTKAGGGDNFKRGDIEEAHRNATRDFDVHLASADMGGAGLSCLDCHTTESHRMAGRGVDLRPRESMDEVSCANCHTEMPHNDNRLDAHTARVNCTVCHIPTYAKKAATDMVRDWSQPGDLLVEKGLYEPHHEKGQNVTPVYRFFNGTSTFYEFGAEAVPGPDGRIVMAAPLGSIEEPNAKIHAFKHHLGNQPIDPDTQRLLPLKIGKFFETGQIGTAVAMGSEAVGWEYTGHDFAQTERYLGLFHEVAPKEQALNCNSCHGGDRMDFAALGYSPKETRNGRALCMSCHGDESGEWKGSEYFFRLHGKHVQGEGYDCMECHSFSSAN